VEHLPIIKYLTNCAKKKIIQNVPFLPISLQKGRVNAKNITASKIADLYQRTTGIPDSTFEKMAE
jgi:hypothetical protein